MSAFTFAANDPFLDLLNTRPEGGADLLKSNDDLIRWMDQAGLIRAGGRPWRWNDRADPLLPRVKRLRESVREQVAAAADGRGFDAEAVRRWDADGAGAPAGTSAAHPEQLYAILARAAAALARKGAAGLRREEAAGGGGRRGRGLSARVTAARSGPRPGGAS